MRYNKKVEMRPHHGETRIVQKFAWLPIECNNGECAWLGKVSILQEFRIDPESHWVNKQFVS